MTPTTDLYFHWRRLIVINLAIMVGYIIYKVSRDFLSLPYIHLLVDYHFGYTRRALFGAIMSLMIDKVPSWMPFVTGIIAIVIAFALYLKLFQKTFGFSKETAPLLVLIAGSPFFFKNFILTMGYFDVIGCAFAITMLLVPARSFWFVVLGAAISQLLILIHSGQTLLFVPTIMVIVVTRYYLVRPLNRTEIIGGVLLLAATAAGTLATVFFGNVKVPVEEFTRYLQSRALATNPNWMEYIFVWYDPLSEGMRLTWAFLPRNLTYSPVYLILMALHLPLIRYFRACLDALSQRDRWFMIAGMAGITAAYIVVFIIVSDYARWVSDWVVCMLLVLHLIKQLPATRIVPPIACDNWSNIRFGIAVTVIPRVGGVTPF